MKIRYMILLGVLFLVVIYVAAFAINQKRIIEHNMKHIENLKDQTPQIILHDKECTYIIDNDTLRNEYYSVRFPVDTYSVWIKGHDTTCVLFINGDNRPIVHEKLLGYFLYEKKMKELFKENLKNYYNEKD